MRSSYRTSAVVIALILGSGSHVFGVAISDGAVGTYAPNPTPLVMSDAASNAAANGISLANFRTLITGAFAANTGGVLDDEDPVRRWHDHRQVAKQWHHLRRWLGECHLNYLRGSSE